MRSKLAQTTTLIHNQTPCVCVFRAAATIRPVTLAIRYRLPHRKLRKVSSAGRFFLHMHATHPRVTERDMDRVVYACTGPAGTATRPYAFYGAGLARELAIDVLFACFLPDEKKGLYS